MKISGRFVVIAVMLLLMAAPVQAQLFKKGVKIGYVDIAKVFDQYEKTDIATEELKGSIEEKKKEIEKKKENINTMKQKLDTQGSVMKKEEKTKMEENVEAKISELKNYTEELNYDLRQRENQLIKDILTDIKEAIDVFGKDNGYDLILDKREVLYGPEGMDVTDAVIGIVNKKLKKK